MRGKVGYLIRLIAPMLWSICKTVFVFTVRTLAVVLIGMPNACSIVANDLKESAIKQGFPSLYERHLYAVCYGIAVIQFVVGWVILSWLTLWIVGWIF